MPSLSQLLTGKSRSKGSGSNHGHSPSWFETRRAAQPTAGTASELYAIAEQREIVDPPLQPYLKQPAVIDAIKRDKVQIPATIDREGYYDNRHLAYWLSGAEDMQMVQRVLPQASYRHVLDFGGATGRFARHVLLADESAQVTLTDLNVNHVEWVAQHFRERVRAAKVSPYPYFPLADNSVSLCVAFSVFTHIDAYETGWLAEIYRVLEVGGHALLTIHSEETWKVLPSQPFLFKRLQRHPEFRDAFRLEEPMPPGRLVLTSNANSIEHNCNVFMDSDYVHERWGRWFEVVDIAHRAHHDFQAAVILRKSR